MTPHSAARVLLPAALWASLASAEPPAEVQGVAFADPASMAWDPVAGADFYNVYRGALSGLASGLPGRCHGYRVASPFFSAVAVPEAGGGLFYVVTAESHLGGEGSAGIDSAGVPRPLLGSCGSVMRNHVLGRLGYGWNEWSRDRIATLGIDSYIDEQLDPSSISEADNTELNTRLASIEPPDTATELVARQVVGGVYARRQLAEQAGSFWTNHFNTDSVKVRDSFERLFPRCNSPGVPPQCDPSYPQRSQREASLAQEKEFDTFQSLSFSGSFREMLEASAKSPAMIIYLDTVTNVATAPNENYAREILELYSMGVDGGYTQQDVEQLSKVFTGWNYCKKAPADAGNPLAACITSYWDPLVPGEWVANFLSNKHDCLPKTLFEGTPEQVSIDSTCVNPAAQVAELETALDAIVAHPSTRRFISKKILERFVTDAPDEALLDAVVAEWKDATNPHGTGDLREILRAALTSPAFLDPDRAGSKIKTPLEHFVAAFRVLRGRTDGTSQVFNYLTRAQHRPYLNPVPTGWPESGGDWIDTNNTLERQNFGIQLAGASGANFGSDPVTLLVANGISTGPGNAPAIVDFLADALFGGALTPAERQAAIHFLDTDDSGNPSAYNNSRIRDLAGFLLGYPQFQEQ